MLASLVVAAIAGLPAAAQAPREYETIDMTDLRAIVERGGLDVVAIERGNLMVSDGRGFPARLTLAACTAEGECSALRIYTRYVIGESDAGIAMTKEFAANFTSATVILLQVAEEPAVDVGRDAKLGRGRTEQELQGEIAEAMSDARTLRDRLVAADPFLKASLGGRN
jgi:hypothetical protein